MKKEDIEKLKQKYGEVYEVTAPNVDRETGEEVIKGGKTEYVGYFRKADRNTLSYASRVSSGLQDPIKFNEALVRNTFIGGDDEIKQQDEFINAVAEQLQTTIKQVEAKLKKI